LRQASAEQAVTEEEPRRTQEKILARARAIARLVFMRLRRLALMRLPAEEAAQVREHVEEEAELTERFVLMGALSAGIAILGLLQSSSAVVIGAMLVSPLMSPIAALGFGLASLDTAKMLRAARTLAVGAGVGVLVGMTITWLSPIRNATPEIIARTAPTLLDLAVALLSGLAGGYATVHRRGETAIGVAIATALMPPLATVGYGLAVARFDFFFGALLLFLTNLAAIAFSFALVARLRGVARSFMRVTITRRLIIACAAALLVLVTPLALTLRATWAAREEIATALNVDDSMIAQLSVSWTNLDPPRISAIVVTSKFDETAEARVRAGIAKKLHVAPVLSLQQLVATDTRAQTEAMIDAALRSQPQRPASNVLDLPIETIRQAAQTPTLSAWVDLPTRTVYLAAAPLPERSLADFQGEETRLDKLRADWRVAIIPPFQERLPILFADNAVTLDAEGERQLQTVVWALRRWGASRVRLEGLSGRSTGASRASRDLADARAAEIGRVMRAAGFETVEARAELSTSRALYELGGAPRVRAVDVVPLGPQP
jgi:uncharacterized hydrophobic protein (TIGR00271 family)